MLTVELLGPIEAHRDGEPVQLPTGKTRELLARLALDVGRLVRADTLLEDLWAEPTARNTLQSKVSQLRRAIGKELVVGTSDGYRLDLPPDAVDVSRALALADACATARTRNDDGAALRAARAGIRLFRGEALLGAGDWAAPHRTRLADLHLSLVEQTAAIRVDLGAGAEIVTELESLVEEHPLREGLWAALITALYRAGRQADALATYRRVRRLLADELGVEPGSCLRSLEQQVLRHTPSLGAAPASVRVPGNLPAQTTQLVGRDGAIAEVLELLTGSRLVTVLGLGGVGKTQVGLEVARRLDPPVGGVWLVRFDGVEIGADLYDVIGSALQVTGGEQSLLERVDGAETVLMLDNCEHLVDPLARTVRSLLDAAPRLRVLVTSQAPLGLAEEQLYHLQPLNQLDSITLFAQLATRMRRTLVLDDAAKAAVTEACRALDGLPLAIELAAARVRSLSVHEIARRLDDRFALLQDPSGAPSERRRTLIGAIGWSYDLLFPDDQLVLLALSCFGDGAGLDGVEHVAGALEVPAEVIIDSLGRLVDRSLVEVDGGAGDTVRYRLLDSIRLYARQRLQRAGLEHAGQAAQAVWFGELAGWCDQNIRTERQPECLALVRAERVNVDAALGWCGVNDPRLGVRIALGFGWAWVVLGDGTAGAARIRLALNELNGPCPARDRAVGLLLASWLEASAGDVGVAQSDLDRARELARQLQDPVLRADVGRHQAFLAIRQGRPDVVIESAAGSEGVYQAAGLDWQRAACLLLGAFGSIMLGDIEHATRDASAALGIVTATGDTWAMVHARAMLGAAAQAEHRYADADRALALAVADSAAAGFLGQAALHRATLARVRHRAGDPRAATTYAEAIEAAMLCGDGRLAATARVNLARLLRRTGDDQAALLLLEQNMRWYDAAGGGDFALLTQCLLAATRDDQQALISTLAAARASGNQEVVVQALDGLARLSAPADGAAAGSLLEEADGLAQRLTHVLDPADRTDAERARRLLTGGIVSNAAVRPGRGGALG